MNSSRREPLVREMFDALPSLLELFTQCGDGFSAPAAEDCARASDEDQQQDRLPSEIDVGHDDEIGACFRVCTSSLLYDSYRSVVVFAASKVCCLVVLENCLQQYIDSFWCAGIFIIFSLFFFPPLLLLEDRLSSDPQTRGRIGPSITIVLLNQPIK